MKALNEGSTKSALATRRRRREGRSYLRLQSPRSAAVCCAVYYLVCDSSQMCYVLSVYGLRNDGIKEGDQVILLEPCYRYVDISWKGKFEHQYMHSINPKQASVLAVSGNRLLWDCGICEDHFAFFLLVLGVSFRVPGAFF
ncbi:unnamed protein product [Ilex paraguariensis]|uniref:Tetratricopeptide repeat protein 5 OB fold domain-containing protein n=1 Tax=Ilex paraguariensis TaxID=185542 RepID=A0ABC8SJP0_9AQUA